MNDRRQHGEDGHRGIQGLDGDRGDRGERGPQGRKGIPGFDGECCAGLVRLMERCENNEEKIDREITYREREEEKIWSEISKTNKRVDGMKTMAITVLASSMLSILLFIGTVVAHILKVGP